MLFSHVTHYYQTCIFGFKFTVSQIHALLSYIPWWMLLLIVGCDLLINPHNCPADLNLLSLSMFASTSSVSKSCAFLEGQDGSRYLGLFRALHLHGITDSKCHRLSYRVSRCLIFDVRWYIVWSCLLNDGSLYWQPCLLLLLLRRWRRYDTILCTVFNTQ